ncbi:MAG: adenylate/guanylate cyclase domain-containing protein [Alsobacter sp.]
MTARILVVDDEPDLEALLTQKFRREIRAGDFAFLFARDGVEALEIIAATPDLDLVLSDINMPRMDGLTLLARVQELHDTLSTVVVSAYGDLANIRTAMNRGAFDFLTKPIDFADLEATIARTVRHVAQQRDSRQRRTEAERAHASLARFFSPSLAAELADASGGRSLAGKRQDISVLFTDIADFTGLVETIDPTVLGELLNGYFAALTTIVFAHGGTVAKVMGDALHVLFNAPQDQPDHAARAVACALALDAKAESLRADWASRGVSLGVTRIGVHAGPALVGNFGGDAFFDYTAHGDTINTAARLERANKALGTRICASEAVALQVEGFLGRPVGDLMLRGRGEALRSFEPLAEDSADTDAYRAAFDRLVCRDPQALPAFAALVGARADDPLAHFHLRRLLNGQTGAVVDLMD